MHNQIFEHVHENIDGSGIFYTVLYNGVVYRFEKKIDRYFVDGLDGFFQLIAKNSFTDIKHCKLNDDGCGVQYSKFVGKIPTGVHGELGDYQMQNGKLKFVPGIQNKINPYFQESVILKMAKYIDSIDDFTKELPDDKKIPIKLNLSRCEGQIFDYLKTHGQTHLNELVNIMHTNYGKTEAAYYKQISISVKQGTLINNNDAISINYDVAELY